MLQKLREKILSRKARIAIIGLGYVGLPLAMAFTRKGFKVYGIDVDEKRVKGLKDSKSYIFDVPSMDIKKAL